jgi:hypothetical protein
MSNQLNPEEKLGEFTPDASLLNRDELMFAAGQASVPRSRFWPMLATVLGITQAITLTLLLTRSESPTPVPMPVVPVVAPVPEAPPSPISEFSLLAQQRQIRDEIDSGYRPMTSSTQLMESKKVFTARSPLNWE